MSVKFYYPAGSSNTINHDGTMTITPPNGWAYLGVKINGDVVQRIDECTKVSCKCTAGTGCDPAELAGEVMCIAEETCTACSMTVVRDSDGSEYMAGGYINPHAPAAIIKTSETFPGQPAKFEESSDACTAVNDFINIIYGTDPYPTLTLTNGRLSCPTGYKITAVNILGRAALIPVPMAQLGPNDAAGDEAYCDCDDGICTLAQVNAPDGTTFNRCTGSCTGTCSLTVCDISPTGEETIIFEAECYQF